MDGRKRRGGCVLLIGGKVSQVRLYMELMSTTKKVQYGRQYWLCFKRTERN